MVQCLFSWSLFLRLSNEGFLSNSKTITFMCYPLYILYSCSSKQQKSLCWGKWNSSESNYYLKKNKKMRLTCVLFPIIQLLHSLLTNWVLLLCLVSWLVGLVWGYDWRTLNYSGIYSISDNLHIVFLWYSMHSCLETFNVLLGCIDRASNEKS
jgi:hypothetical protein